MNVFHYDKDLVLAFLTGIFEEEDKEEMFEHLSSCDDCLALFLEIVGKASLPYYWNSLKPKENCINEKTLIAYTNKEITDKKKVEEIALHLRECDYCLSQVAKRIKTKKQAEIETMMEKLMSIPGIQYITEPLPGLEPALADEAKWDIGFDGEQLLDFGSVSSPINRIAPLSAEVLGKKKKKGVGKIVEGKKLKLSTIAEKKKNEIVFKISGQKGEKLPKDIKIEFKKGGTVIEPAESKRVEITYRFSLEPALFNLSVYLTKEEKLDINIQIDLKEVKIKEEDYSSQKKRAEQLFNEGKIAEAIPRLEKLKPSEDVVSLLAEAYYQQNLIDKAIAVIMPFGHSENPHILSTLGKIQVARDNLKEAVETIRKSIELTPLDEKNYPQILSSYFLLLQIYNKQGDFTNVWKLVLEMEKKGIASPETDVKIISGFKDLAGRFLKRRLGQLTSIENLIALKNALERDKCYNEVSLVNEEIARRRGGEQNAGI